MKEINESTPYLNHYFHGNNNDSDDKLKGVLSFGSFSGGFDSLGNGPLYDDDHEKTLNPTFKYMDDDSELMMMTKNRHNKECMLDIIPYDELGLCENLQRFHIGADEQRSNHPNGVGGFNEDAFNGTFNPMGFRQGFGVNDSMESLPFLSNTHSSAVYNEEQLEVFMRLKKEQEIGYCSRDVPVQMPSGINDIEMPSWINDNSSLNSSQLFNPLLGVDLGLGYNFPMEKLNAKSVVNKKSNRSSKVNHKKKQRNDFLKERSHEKEMAVDGNLRNDQWKCKEVCENGSFQGTSDAMPSLPWKPLYYSLADLKGYIYLISKHQLGCRFLQSVFDEGNNEDVKIIFSEIVPHVVELMMDPFANYVIQKLIDYCSEEQKLKIVLMVTKKRGELVTICMNTYGTRVLQTLIENIKSKQQISLLMIALKPGMVEIIKDMNGNHVVQRCLQCLTNDQNKFIFDAAAKYCVEIACHRHGCCVLNRCVAYSSGMHREKLITSISANGLLLAQDAFGNYVIQHIIELKIPYAAATLLSVFEGHYAYMSMQKFSSHVVEKCLRCLEDSRSRIIHELLSVPYFDQVLQDRFANYVIQAALEVTKGSLHSVLVEAVRPYQILRTSPYCKKIFSRTLLKK